MTKRFVGSRQMTEKLGVSRTQIQRWVACEVLPKPLRLGTNKTSRTVWREHEVEAAMEVMANRCMRLELGLEVHRATGRPHAL